MSRMIRRSGDTPVRIEDFFDGRERSDGKRWNRAQTNRFPDMLIESGSIKSKDGLRRVERAKDKTPDVVAIRRNLAEQQARREQQREANKTPEQKLEAMIRNAFRNDR